MANQIWVMSNRNPFVCLFVTC